MPKQRRRRGGDGQGSDDLWDTASKPFELDQECHGNLVTAELPH